MDVLNRSVCVNSFAVDQVTWIVNVKDNYSFVRGSVSPGLLWSI
jgi:hypothetical protein